jgi:SAM-dependent methyltransferase
MEFDRIADKKRVHFITSVIRQNVPPGASILDVGCGNGIITQAVGEMGFEVTGVDSSQKSIEYARNRNNLPNVTFVLTEAGNFPPTNRKYSAIICSEVLEHLHDPSSLLGVLKKELSDDGVLVVTVPNGAGPRELLVTRPVQSLQENNNIIWKTLSAIKRSLGYTGVTVQSSADDLRHIQFFTYAALKKLAESNGFYISEVRKSNFIEQVFPFSLIIRRSKTLQKADCRVADVLPLAFTSGFMTTWRKKIT